MPDLDQRVRLAAFAFLDRQTQLHGETLPRTVLAQGFEFDGRRVPLLGPEGIFKPAILPSIPLSITTGPPSDRKPRPYDDEFECATRLLRSRRSGQSADAGVVTALSPHLYGCEEGITRSTSRVVGRRKDALDGVL